MGKKKKKAIPKVWCFYCEREFDDEKILIQHQKAKHFKCHVCHKKLSTAGGLVIHVLQVHKQAITKVPNAKPERESTELEIFGMEGIPPEILAAHEGDQDDERPTKTAKVDVPSFTPGALVSSAPLPLPVYRPAAPMYGAHQTGVSQQPAPWAGQPPASQPWRPGYVYPRPPGVPLPRPPLPLPQPLFPIQGANVPSSVPAFSQPPPQPLFPISASANQGASPAPPPLPVYPPPMVPPGAPPGFQTPLVSSASEPSATLSTSEAKSAEGFGSGTVQGLTSSLSHPQAVPGVAAASGVSSQHSYAAAPNTGAACIGPPPVISNKAPGQPTANEVYLVWDDEAMSMEERRLLLPRYQVHDEAFQMNSVDAAIDKRILESKLASRMSFGV